jgi:hypothetical protein
MYFSASGTASSSKLRTGGRRSHYSEMFFKLFGGQVSLLEDTVQGSGRYFPVHGDNAADSAVYSDFLQHNVAAALSYRFKSKSFECFYYLFA